MPYTIEEIAKAVGISPRSVYVYAERRLVPPPLKQGRRFVYTEEHLEALRLVRVLLRLGLPSRQVEQLVVGREQGEVRRALAPVLPLAKLLDEVEGHVADLQRKVRAPASDDLDLGDLGLEDPVRLRHELGEAERQRDRLQREFDQAGAAVLRELVNPVTSPPRSTYDSAPVMPAEEAINLRLHLETVAADLRERLDRVWSTLTDDRAAAEREAFIAGLAAARAAGWQPDPTAPPPIALHSELAPAFRAFVAAQASTDGPRDGATEEAALR